MDNQLWIYSDDKKWCIDKNIFSEIFDGTPILNSIMNFNDTIVIDEYRFLSISPEYCELFTKILRKEISLFKISTVNYSNVKDVFYLPDIHYHFFGIDYIKENIIRNYFTTENLKLLLQSKSEVKNNFEDDFNFEILGKKFTIFDIFKFEYVDIYNTLGDRDIADISLRFLRTNTYLKGVVDLFSLIHCIFTERNITLDIEYKKRLKDEIAIKCDEYFMNTEFKNIKYYSLIYSHYNKVKELIFDYTGEIMYDNKLFLDNNYPVISLTEKFISKMNALALFFNDDKFIHKEFLNHTFVEYKNRTNDNIIQRRNDYYKQICNYVRQFKNFYKYSYMLINKEFKYHIENF